MSKIETKEKEREKAIVRVELVTLVVNTILAFFKLVAGFLGNSMSMISDSIHSFSDSATTIAVMIGVKISAKPSDEDHPYGHEKLESVIGVITATILAIIALSIFSSGCENIIDYIKGDYKSSKIGVLALIAAGTSIIVKEILYFYAIIVAKKNKSPALRADAWHHQSDCLSSIGSLIGIGLAMFTSITIADSIAAIIISIFIVYIAWKILQEAIDEITDKAIDNDTLEKAKNIIRSVEGVKRIDSLKSRKHGIKIYFDVEISVSNNLSVVEAHDIAERVHLNIENGIEDTKHCTVHVNPENIIH